MLSRKAYLYLWKYNYEYNRKKCKAIALALKSDGCTGVPNFYLNRCYEHDIAYKTGIGFIDGKSVNKKEADTRLKWGIQSDSWFGRYSPLAWWRYQFLTRFVHNSWKADQAMPSTALWYPHF